MDEKIADSVDAPVVACDMTGAPDTPEERMAEYARLFDRHLSGRERTAEGVRFRLRADEGVEEWVRELMAKEKACCPFFDFAVETVGDEVRWDVSVIDDATARAVLDEFYRVPETAAGGWEAVEAGLAGRGFTVTTNAGRTVTWVLPSA